MVRHYYVRLDLDIVRPSRTDIHAIKVLEAGVQTSCPFQYEATSESKTHRSNLQREVPPCIVCLTLILNFYSAKSYRFVRKTSDLQLPHPSVIRKGYSSIDGQPGFMAESFNTLEMKAREAKESGHELVCALMLDEMAIKCL